MKNVAIGIGFVLVLVGGGYWLLLNQMTAQTDGEAVAQYETVTSDEYGIVFAYRITPDGYVLIEESRQSGDLQTLLYSYRLIAKDEYEDLQAQREIREAPPIISITIYLKQSGVSAADLESGIMDYVARDLRITEPSVFELGEETGVQYRADGLYASDVVLFTSDEYLYRIEGEFTTEEDMVYHDFLDLVETITFQ